MDPQVRPVCWLGASRAEVRAFPAAARTRAGYELFRVQQGLTPTDWKPMSSVGPGVVELRIHAGAAFRILYVSRFEEAIYVLHAFEKRTRRTRALDVEIGRKRLRDLVRRRSRR